MIQQIPLDQIFLYGRFFETYSLKISLACLSGLV